MSLISKRYCDACNADITDFRCYVTVRSIKEYDFCNNDCLEAWAQKLKEQALSVSTGVKIT